MVPLDLTTLRPGQRLSRAVYSSMGAKLLPRGARLTAQSITSLRGYSGALYLGFPGAMRASSRSSEVAPPAPDTLLPASVLLRDLPTTPEEADDELRPDPEVERVEAASVRAWLIRLKHAEDIVGERRDRWEALPTDVERGMDPLLPAAVGARVRSTPGPWPVGDAMDRFRAERVDELRITLLRISAGRERTAEHPLRLVDELIARLLAHPERFTQLALHAGRDPDYLPDQAFSTGVLSIAVAARLGWSAEDVRLAGLAGLLCDCGMARVPAAIRSADKPLDEVEINRVRRHTALTVAMLSAVAGVDERVIRACHQHHEREDGSGYPHALRGKQIGALAKVLAVAEAFAAAAAARPYRLYIKRPYDAMAEMIRLAAAGKFDRQTVRALVEIAGLFPVGSWVRLNTGERAMVIGSNPEAADRPIVRVVASPRAAGQDRPTEFGRTIDLAECEPWELSVSQAIDGAAPGAAAAA